MDAELTSREKLVATGSCLLAAVLVALDVLADIRAGSSLSHVAIEVGVLALVCVNLVALWLRALLSSRRRVQLLEDSLLRVRHESAYWRGEAGNLLRGLGAAIDQQFARWEFTLSEKEVALMLLKGLSLKHVAEVRQVSTKTVRQQSLAVYRKSSLSGRAELSAYFLEDLLLPLAAPPRAADRGA